MKTPNSLFNLNVIYLLFDVSNVQQLETGLPGSWCLCQNWQNHKVLEREREVMEWIVAVPGD